MKNKIESIKPFVSLITIIISLLSIVFCKMEVRRIGYMFWKETKVEKKYKDELRLYSLEYSGLTRPDRIEKFAKKFWDLDTPKNRQIVQLTYQSKRAL